MVNYDNGKIYKIICYDTGLVYVGSTTKKYLSQRLTNHRSAYKRYVNGTPQCYITAFEVLKADNYKIELIETYPCKSLDELRAREGHHIRQIDCVNKMMKIAPEDRAEHRKAYDLQYREQNPDKIKLKTRRYYNENKASCLLKSKEWKAKNPEKTRAWKEKNRTKLKEYDAKRLEKIQCECGCMVAKMHLGTHQKTMKHSRLLKQVNDTITEDPA